MRPITSMMAQKAIKQVETPSMVDGTLPCSFPAVPGAETVLYGKAQLAATPSPDSPASIMSSAGSFVTFGRNLMPTRNFTYNFSSWIGAVSIIRQGTYSQQMMYCMFNLLKSMSPFTISYSNPYPDICIALFIIGTRTDNTISYWSSYYSDKGDSTRTVTIPETLDFTNIESIVIRFHRPDGADNVSRTFNDIQIIPGVYPADAIIPYTPYQTSSVSLTYLYAIPAPAESPEHWEVRDTLTYIGDGKWRKQLVTLPFVPRGAHQPVYRETHHDDGCASITIWGVGIDYDAQYIICSHFAQIPSHDSYGEGVAICRSGNIMGLAFRISLALIGCTVESSSAEIVAAARAYFEEQYTNGTRIELYAKRRVPIDTIYDRGTPYEFGTNTAVVYVPNANYLDVDGTASLLVRR